MPITNNVILQQLEEFRHGRDIVLLLHVRVGIATFAAQSQTSFTTTSVNSQEHSTGHCLFRIAKSDWLTILKSIGYGDYYLSAIPVKSLRGLSFKKPIEHLEAAWNQFNQGNDTEAIASCYRSLETLAKNFGLENPDQNAWEKILQRVDGRKRAKLKLLLHQVGNFMHLGRHELGDAEHVPLERADAELALIMTNSVLAYLARLPLPSSKYPTTIKSAAYSKKEQKAIS